MQCLLDYQQEKWGRLSRCRLQKKAEHVHFYCAVQNTTSIIQNDSVLSPQMERNSQSCLFPLILNLKAYIICESSGREFLISVFLETCGLRWWNYSLVSWKSTSWPLRAFFKRCVMIFSCIICWRIVMSGLVMSISTSGLLIWLARPSPITSGRYLSAHEHSFNMWNTGWTF